MLPMTQDVGLRPDTTNDQGTPRETLPCKRETQR